MCYSSEGKGLPNRSITALSGEGIQAALGAKKYPKVTPHSKPHTTHFLRRKSPVGWLSLLRWEAAEDWAEDRIYSFLWDRAFQGRDFRNGGWWFFKSWAPAFYSVGWNSAACACRGWVQSLVVGGPRGQGLTTSHREVTGTFFFWTIPKYSTQCSIIISWPRHRCYFSNYLFSFPSFSFFFLFMTSGELPTLVVSEKSIKHFLNVLNIFFPKQKAKTIPRELISSSAPAPKQSALGPNCSYPRTDIYHLPQSRHPGQLQMHSYINFSSSVWGHPLTALRRSKNDLQMFSPSTIRV